MGRTILTFPIGNNEVIDVDAEDLFRQLLRSELRERVCKIFFDEFLDVVKVAEEQQEKLTGDKSREICEAIVRLSERVQEVCRYVTTVQIAMECDCEVCTERREKARLADLKVN